MKKLKADRRLYLTVEKDQVVEEGDPNGAWLLYATGRVLAAGDVERYGMGEDKFGRVVYDGCPRLRRPKAEVAEGAEESKESEDTGEEISEDEPGKVLQFGGGDDSDRNDGAPPEWPDTMTLAPVAYLKRYPNGPNADLARAVIAAQDDGAGGAS